MKEFFAFLFCTMFMVVFSQETFGVCEREDCHEVVFTDHYHLHIDRSQIGKNYNFPMVIQDSMYMGKIYRNMSVMVFYPYKDNFPTRRWVSIDIRISNPQDSMYIMDFFVHPMFQKEGEDEIVLIESGRKYIHQVYTGISKALAKEEMNTIIRSFFKL